MSRLPPTERNTIVLRTASIAGAWRLLFVVALIALITVSAGASGCSPVQRRERGKALLADAKKDYETGRFAESEATLREVLEDSPEDVDALQTMALAQAAQGKNEDAIAQYRKVVELAPKDHASWYRMALLERIVGKPKDSAEHLQKALSQKPGDPSYTDELARTKMSLGEYEAAADLWGSLLTDATASKESKKELYVLQGQAYQSAKDFGNAKKAFVAALELDPNDKELQAKVESFE